MNKFRISDNKIYQIREIEKIKTPRLLVFGDRLKKNLSQIKKYLENVAPGTAYKHLCPHVKTNKSSFIIKMMFESGINSFKSSMNEVELLVSLNVNEIFIAYPLLKQDAIFIAKRIRKHPEIDFQVQIGSEEHFNILQEVAEKFNINWSYFIDLDVGMHRTGINPDNAFNLYQRIGQNDRFNFLGLHAYDGHNHFAEKEKHRQEAEKSMSNLLKVFSQFSEHKIHVPKVIVAGSPSFKVDFEILYPAIQNQTLLQVSPGTWIYWDSQYDNILPGEFEFATLILAQVIEVKENQITLNLGHKRWAADQGKLQLFSESELEVISFSEEHTVLKTNNVKKYHTGDYILIVPRHICPTVNLYENFTLINENGEIEIESVPIDGRNR